MKLLGLFHGGYAFEEPHRKNPQKKRLTITCHGGIDFVEVNGAPMDALRLALFIRLSTDIAALQTVRVISCFSADSTLDLKPGLSHTLEELTAQSFCSKLSRLLPTILVKGYLGEVEIQSATDRHVSEVLAKSSIDTLSKFERELSDFKVFKDGMSNYHGVTFLNGIAIRQSLSRPDRK